MNERIAELGRRCDAIGSLARLSPTPKNTGRWYLAEAAVVVAEKLPRSRLTDTEQLADALALFESVIELLETDMLSAFAGDDK